MRRALFLALLAACNHGEPFRSDEYAPDGPINGPPFVRLTLNPAGDFAPVWMPDGTLLYTAHRLDRTDADRCFAALPAQGGSISRYVCRSTASDDSTNVFEEAAPSGAGIIAYVRAGTHRLPFRPISPDVQELVLAPLDNPNDARARQAIPYTAPSGRVHSGVSHIGWLNSSTLVYLGEEVTYPRGCSSCAPDTVRTGLEIVTFNFTNATPTLAVVPGTSGATAVTVGASGDTIYFTLAGDPIVYRHIFSATQTDSVYDFSTSGAPIDIAVENGRLVAAVGDDLHFVTLADSTDMVVSDPSATYMFRRPVFSLDGTRVAVEAWLRGGTGDPDIWLVSVP